MNISFTKLGIEECELCDAYTIHTQEHKKRLRKEKKQSKSNKKEDRETEEEGNAPHNDVAEVVHKKPHNENANTEIEKCVEDCSICSCRTI